MRAAFLSVLLVAACQAEPPAAPEPAPVATQSESVPPSFTFDTEPPRSNTDTVAVAAGPDADRLAQQECRGGAVQEWGRNTGDTVVYRCTGEAF